MMFVLTLVTPEKKIVTEQELEEITVPAFSGELNILPGHSPLMTTLTPGILKYKLKNGESDTLAIGWGYAQVSAQGVSVMAESTERAVDVDVAKAKASLKTLEARLDQETLDDKDWDKIQNEIGKLHAELELSSGNQTTH